MICVLGLTGYGGSGKDTFADILAENYGFTKIAFADPIREILLRMNPVVVVEDDRPVLLGELVDAIGWDEAKRLYPAIRNHLVDLGMGARESLGWRIWINEALKRAGNNPRVVFSDVRMVDEARFLRGACGAYIVKIRRPGVGPAHDQEALEIPYSMTDYIVDNDKDLVNLKIHADWLVNRIQLKEYQYASGKSR